MISRWLLRCEARRKRRPRSKALPGFRLEALERRYCMANDFDVSPIPIYQNIAPLPPLAIVDYSLVQRRQTSDPDCEVPASFATANQDVELCIDNFVGARYVSLRMATASAITNAQLFLADSRDTALQVIPKAAGVDAVFAVAVSDALRPNLPVVQQMTVGEGEGPAQPVLAKPHAVGASNHAAQSSVARNVASAATSTPLTAGFVTSIDRVATTASDADTSSRSSSGVGAIWTTPAPHTEGTLLSAVDQSSIQSSWTGLVAERTPPIALDAELSGHETRPQLILVPGRQLIETTKAEAVTDVPTQHSHLANSREIENQREREVLATPLGIPVIAASVHQEGGDETGETGIALPTEDSASKEEEPLTTVAPVRTSRYWFLAAIPVFFAIPRRPMNVKRAVGLARCGKKN